MKEVHIVTVDDRIIGVYANKDRANKEFRVLTNAANVIDLLNSHKIFVKSMKVIE